MSDRSKALKSAVINRRRQRGAAALFAAIGLLAMVAATAFAVDIAQLYIAKRQLQNMTNLAALDVARAAGGCLAPDLERQTIANQTALATISRLNGEADWLQDNQVVLGRGVRTAAGERDFVAVPTSSAGEAYAFRLNLQRPMPALVMPLFQTDAQARLSASADSVMAPVPNYNVASFGVSIDPTEASVLNGLLSNIFGNPFNLTLISYQGLLSSSVELLDVADQMAATTLQELLGESTELPGLLEAIADALFAVGDNIAGDAFDAAAAAAPNELVVLGDALGSPSNSIVGLGNTTLNTLDLLQNLAMQIGDPVISLTPGLSIPPLTTGTVEIELGAPPVQASGPPLLDEFSNYVTTATNSQGRVAVDLGLPLLGDLAQVNLELDIAEARADLIEVRCAGRGRANHEVDIGVETTIARLRINNPESSPLINLLGLVKVCWEGEVEVGEDDYDVLTFSGPYPETQPVGSSIGASLSNALGDLIVESPPQLCGNLSSLNVLLLLLGLGNSNSLLGQIVADLLPTLTAGLDANLLDPLLAALGLSVGGAHITVSSVAMPPPALIESK